MRIQCFSQDDAEACARLMKDAGHHRPASVVITYEDTTAREYWAVSDSHALESIGGHVESIHIP